MAELKNNGPSGKPEPSENVKELNEATSKRQDDLRLANTDLFQAQLKCLEENITLHVKHMKDMARAEARRVDEQASLRAEYAERLSSAEAKRIDAIRAVDVNAVSVASQRASDQATVLANQVAQSAEALRGLVASTAATNAQSQATANNTLSTRITTLEQAQYKGEGQSGVRDPQMIDLLAEVKALRESRASTTGVGQGIDKMWGVVAVVATLIISGTVALVTINRAPVAAPQVVYMPAPAPSAPSAPGAPSSPGGPPPIVTAPATVVPPATTR